MTDGAGAYEVVRTLLYYYCSERYNVKLNDEGIRLAGDEISAEEWDDPVANRADLPSVIVLHNGLYFRKRLDTLLGFVGGVLILICGSRGAALVFCISIVLYTVIMDKLKQKAGIICIVAVAGIIFYMAGEKIILLALEQLNNYGFRARTLHKIVNDTIMSDSQRLQGYAQCY